MTDLQLKAGQNCWRVENADRFAFIIDGQDYFRALRESLMQAKRLILMIGWDFDFEIEMLPGESDENGNAPDGMPNRVGEFLDALVDRREGLDIYLLKWSGGALVAPGGALPAIRVKFLSPDQIHLAFDGCHPIGACHHQKIVVIDDSLAFCGGIDVTDGRWDRPAHRHADPLRLSRAGEISQPWHDASAIMSGPVAASLSELARTRWKRAQGREVDESFEPGSSIWPESVPPALEDVRIAIARTEPPENDRPIVTEIEQLYLDSIAAARDIIYLESQYFCAESVTQAILDRLQEPDGPEVVIINPDAAQKYVEDQAMHVTRSRMVRTLRAHDPHDRFRIVHPVNDAEESIYVHAKIAIIDDHLLRVGSSNIDQRSMGFDTECDVAIVGDGTDTRAYIRKIRLKLLSEHLGLSPDEVTHSIERFGSLVAAIDNLGSGPGRGLRPLPLREKDWLGEILSSTRLFDPRYRASARARIGITSRHVFVGAGVLAAGALLWRLNRRRTRD
ncbi:phospholipase D-like domain-containing protein [Paracoccus sp. MBLB3053]|uniref:Phospholipase D n=1 Tax=Paracoccus aurantius TaxID=3073814 RepID=A0ABU2HX77_9RHOB|nr:phospholipase D-like domain-containing protein [Paracoccus sp. MBLB3053]MDS9469209.1 phospholipase D-like domain-containing protein [Paracoccus sp. MBLB3053]